MAWFTEQILADFLNKCEDFSVVKDELYEIISDDVVLQYASEEYYGKRAVVGFFEEMANAIAVDFGFYAIPVIVCNTEDAMFQMVKDKLYKAVALHSKLEEYVSWLFLLKCNDDFQINRIDATQGYGYQYYRDVYEKQEYKREDFK